MKIVVSSVLVSVFVASSALGQQVGCFVNFSSPTQCDEDEIACGENVTENLGKYGYPIAFLCTSANRAARAAQDAVSLQQVCTNYLRECQTAYNNTEWNREQWVAYSNYQAGVIKKLVRACGSKCKRIR